MKYLYILIFFCILNISNAQNTVTLEITHLLDMETLTFGETTQNNLDNSFFLNRMQYYISNISIIHDGGQETDIEDTYALITCGTKTTSEINLGIHDMSNVERIIFHIGVDSANNHLDPGMYAPEHALAPKSPSMHWGWQGGYRFIALEGRSGSDVNETLAMHVIGDANFEKIEIPVNVSAENDAILIPINADYKESLHQIDISQGLIQHGEINQIITLVNNFQNRVFTNSQGIVPNQQYELNNSIKTYPNPSSVGSFNLTFGNEVEVSTLEIYSVNGAKIHSVSQPSDNMILEINSPGMYIIKAFDSKNTLIGTKKHIVQ